MTKTQENALLIIAPYWFEGTWVFDDPAVGLTREPFVLGVPEMIDNLVQGISNARAGFRLIFSKAPFPGYQLKLDWVREETGWRALSSGIPENLLFWGVSLCDLLGNGRQELFLATDGAQNPTFGPRVLSLEGERWTDLSAGLPVFAGRDVAAGDLEGNGSCTLAVTQMQKGSVRLFRYSRARRWEEWMTLERPADVEGRLYGLTIADVDGDGREDLITNYARAPYRGGIQVWLSRPQDH